MDDDAIRRAYTAAAVSRGADRSACPSADALRALAGETQHTDDAAGAFDHVMSCRPCQEEYELLRSILVAERQATARPVPWRLAPMALAASVVIAVALGGVYARQRAVPDGEGAVRGGVSATHAGGDAIVLVAPSSRIVRGDSLRLAWHPVAEADAYRVELLDTAGALVHSTVTGDTTVAFPPAMLPVSLAQFDWLVVARRADGSEQHSPLHRVTVAP